MGRKSIESKLEFEKAIKKEEKEYRLLTPYKKSKEKVKILHLKCNTIFEITPQNFKKGQRCPNPECIKERIKQTFLKKYGVDNPSKRRDFQKEKIRKYAEKFYNFVKETGEFEILSEYKGNEEKVKLKHLKCGLIFETTPHNFMKHPKGRCPNPKCIKEKTIETFKKKYGKEWGSQAEEIKEKVKKTFKDKYGVEWVSQIEEVKEKRKKTYIEHFGVDSPLKSSEIINKIRQTNLKKYGVDWISKDKNIQEKKEETLLQKYGVKSVFQSEKIKKKIVENKKKNYYNQKIKNFKHILPLFEERDYNGIFEKYEWKCVKCGHIFKDSLENGRIPRCPKCYPVKGKSLIEKEIKKWISSLIEIEENKRFYEKGKYKYEIDIFVPSKNLGIEIDGLYWHSEIAGGKDKNYHLEKTKYFEKKGIRLIHIFDNEWLEKQDLIKSFIKNQLGLIKNKLYARKCEVKEIDTKIKNKFLNENHLQGEDKSKIKLGLFYNEELVSVMTFGKPRFNTKYEWEIIRYANKKDLSVIGSFGKLLNYFIEKYKPSSIISYADKRFFDGQIYLKNKFELINESLPNYFYTKDYKSLETRENYQKYRLKDKLEFFSPQLSEWENMQMNGYDRIWDCGNYVFGKVIDY